jgi:hypothetical protein
MRVDAFHNWRRELEAVEQEMNSLIAQGLPASSQERQVRRTRFAALIERREAAARNLLRSDIVSRRSKVPTRTPIPGDHVIAPAHAPAGSEGQVETFVPLPEGTRKADAQPGRPADRPADLADIWKPDRGAAAVPPTAAPNLAAAVADPAHPAEPPRIPDASIPNASIPNASIPDSRPPISSVLHSSVRDSAVLADSDSLPADVAAPAPDADSPVTGSAAPDATAGAPAKPAELPAAVLALVAEAAALASESDAVPPASASDAAPPPATDVVSLAVASIAAAIASVSDPAVPAAAAPEPAAPATDVVVLVPDASIPATAESSTGSTAPIDHSVDDPAANHPSGIVASPGEVASVVPEAETQPVPASDDPQSEALLLKLLRRLQFGPGTKRT